MTGLTLQQLYNLYIRKTAEAEQKARQWQEKAETAETPHQAGVWRAKAKSWRDHAKGNRARATRIKERLEKQR